MKLNFNYINMNSYSNFLIILLTIIFQYTLSFSFNKGIIKTIKNVVINKSKNILESSKQVITSNYAPWQASGSSSTGRKTEPLKPRNKRTVGRSRNKQENNEQYGRISVYCVGNAIDIQALRAHVFRRGFGNQVNEQKDNSELVLSRGLSGNTNTDEEVLHVSNAPLFISLDSNNNNNNNNNNMDNRINNRDMLSMNHIDNNSDEEENNWKAKERLLMTTQDIFYFDYGCVVFWGLTPAEEKAAMTELAQFTLEPVSPMELDNSYDTMEFVLDRKANPQRPIRFDRMRLRTLVLEEKLALSYAMAQSSKLFVFESKVLQSVEMTRYLPKELANKGKIGSSKKELNMLIGQLFVEQTEVNLFSSILDTPDFLWEDDEHLPAYEYTRSYLEVDDRVALLNSRLSVIRDLLDVLNSQVADNNSTRLEWIIIWLISVEIVMGIMSNPLFTGRRVLAALLVPSAILAYKKIDWSNFNIFE